MICNHCRDAAVVNELGRDMLARLLHMQCLDGTWCDCSHDTSQSAINPAFKSTSNEATHG